MTRTAKSRKQICPTAALQARKVHRATLDPQEPTDRMVLTVQLVRKDLPALRAARDRKGSRAYRARLETR